MELYTWMFYHIQQFILEVHWFFPSGCVILVSWIIIIRLSISNHSRDCLNFLHAAWKNALRILFSEHKEVQNHSKNYVKLVNVWLQVRLKSTLNIVLVCIRSFLKTTATNFILLFMLRTCCLCPSVYTGFLCALSDLHFKNCFPPGTFEKRQACLSSSGVNSGTLCRDRKLVNDIKTFFKFCFDRVYWKNRIHRAQTNGRTRLWCGCCR